MRLRTITTSILAIGLLAGSSIGVAAQDEGAASGAAYFTWDTAGPPEFSTDENGRDVVTVAIEATDPRASGTATNLEDGGQVDDGGWGYNVLVSAVRLVNDGGSWVGMGRGANARDTDDEDAGGRAWLTEYAGEGGYEGLTMYTFRMGTGAEPPESIGFILPAELIPPFPEPPAE